MRADVKQWGFIKIIVAEGGGRHDTNLSMLGFGQQLLLKLLLKLLQTLRVLVLVKVQMLRLFTTSLGR